MLKTKTIIQVDSGDLESFFSYATIGLGCSDDAFLIPSPFSITVFIHHTAFNH